MTIEKPLRSNPLANASVLKASLDLMYYSGASALLRPLFQGIGAIFMLHHVTPGGGHAPGFAPNRGLEVTPEFLDRTITLLKSRGVDMVDLDEAKRRIEQGGDYFAVFTADDGYHDNLVHALPVFQRHQCPFTVYVAPAIADGTCELWWRGLELAIARNPSVKAELGGESIELPCADDASRWAAWHRLYWPVRQMRQQDQRRWIRRFCSAHGVDLDAYCREQAMGWDAIRRLAADPLCTIGAHTVNHYAVKALSADEALAELLSSAGRIAQELGQRPRHMAFPYGDQASAGARDFALARRAGYETAVTTRHGMIFRGHAAHLTALPRFSLAGEYQDIRYVKALLSGLPFALFNRFRLVDAA